ncbi:hypothetical protein ACWC9T_37465 [Kitasatospora sp. NPDC001159]
MPSFAVVLHRSDLDGLAEAVRLAAAEKAWLTERCLAHRGLRGAALAAARQELRAERELERAAGRLVVARALRAELSIRGWDGQWSAPRPGAIGSGRRWGSASSRYQHAEGAARFEESLTVRLSTGSPPRSSTASSSLPAAPNTAPRSSGSRPTSSPPATSCAPPSGEPSPCQCPRGRQSLRGH